MREPEERAQRIRRFLTSVTSLQLNDKVDQNEFVKFSDELADNLSKLRLVDFVITYNEFDKTLDSVWKLIGGYTLSVAQFFSDGNEPSDSLSVISIHSPEKELLVSADGFVESVVDKLLELESGWSETGYPERICEKFGCFSMRNYQNELQVIREEKRNPSIVGNIVKQIIKNFQYGERKIRATVIKRFSRDGSGLEKSVYSRNGCVCRSLTHF